MSMGIGSVGAGQLSASSTGSAVGVSVLAKEEDQVRQDGAAEVSLIQTAAVPPNGGTLVNTYA